MYMNTHTKPDGHISTDRRFPCQLTRIIYIVLVFPFPIRLISSALVLGSKLDRDSIYENLK